MPRNQLESNTRERRRDRSNSQSTRARTCKGSASMSARSATTGPSPPPAMVATTPVCATGHAYGTPIASSSARTSSLVRCSWKPSSGRSWMRRRTPRSHAAKPGARDAPRSSPPRAGDGDAAALAGRRGDRTRRMRKRRRGVGARGDGGDAIARRAAAGDTSGVMAGTHNPFCFNQLDSPSESELFSALSQEAFFLFLFSFSSKL